MATFFQSFRSSTMPKRLLRYALSRLELLEEETLDLDNLDFALGRNTTFEFKDVGVRLKKLQRLLKLPPSFKLQTAKVLKLTVTIPMDFYTSPIIVEVDGVDIRLQALTSEDGTSKNRGNQTGAKFSEERDVVPHTLDLAASFLETEPLAEKKKLEDALAAETQDLGASVAMSESSNSEDDDENNFGTGQPLSLPDFLADFLQGIVDRTQLRVRGVRFQLDIEVPLESNATSTDLVTFQLELDRIDVEGVTAKADGDGDGDGDGDDDPKPTIQHKEGKRHISLSDVRACLISEANVFSTFARSPSVSSPAASRVASFTEREPSPSPPQPGFSSHPSLHDNELAESVGLSDVDEDLLRDSEDALEIPYDMDDEPAPEEEGTNTPRASIYQDTTPAPLPDIPRRDDSPDEDAFLPWTEDPSNPSFDPPTEALTTTPSRTDDPSSPRESTHSYNSQYIKPEEQESKREEEEDLTRSHLFTHEEAESMYMSAFSHAESQNLPSQHLPSQPSTSQQLPSQMPGAWDDSPESSPNAFKPPTVRQAEPLDEADAKLRDAPLQRDMERLTPGTDSFRESVRPLDQLDQEHVESEPYQYPAEFAHAAVAPSQEDVPTPRGPTRLVKEIISLDRIGIYVPSLHRHLHVQPGQQASTEQLAETSAGLTKSVGPQVPGAFSVHAAASSHADDASAEPKSATAQATSSETDESLEVVFSPIDIRFDASLAFLLVTVMGKLLDALKGASGPTGKPSTSQEQTLSASPPIKLMVERISLLFLNQLGGVADTAERIFSPQNMHMQPELLLQMVIDKVTIGVKRLDSQTDTSIDLEKFKLGYAKEDIITFDQSLQMRTSVVDRLPSAGADVSLKVTSSPTSVRSEVITLPLLVQLDLQRLDETFSWFGGLSSVLSMSSSMSSNASASIKSPVQPPSKPRGVRFSTPIHPDDKSAASQNKMDLRIGGFNLELKGKECIIGLETSAVKMVSRESGVGFAISKARLAGPYLRDSRGEPPVTAELGGIRFDYQDAPNSRDLERLLELITPTKAKFDNADDEIMVDTLLRQRRKGSILRVTLDQLHVKIGKMQQLACLSGLGDELARLGTVAKYLPEDDRPGLLTLGKVHEIRVSLEFGGKIGLVGTEVNDVEVAHITVPSLVAVGLEYVFVERNNQETLVSSPDASQLGSSSPGPVLMARLIGDEMEPAVKLRIRDVTVDYRVPTIMDILDLANDATPQDFEASLAASVANLSGQAHAALSNKQPPSRRSAEPGKAKSNGNGKPIKVDVLFKNCLLGLNPLKHSSRLVVAMTDARLEVVPPTDGNMQATLHINKADLLLTDDDSKTLNKDLTTSARRQRPRSSSSAQVSELFSRGYVSICYISTAKVAINVTTSLSDDQRRVDIQVRDDLLVLETCADSTQTLIALANGLSPPTPPSKENKYRTKVIPMQDLLASISPEAFGRAEGAYDFDEDFPEAETVGAGSDDEYDITIGSGSLPDHAHPDREEELVEQLFSAGGSMMSGVSRASSRRDVDAEFGTGSAHASDDSGDLVIDENYFTKKQDLDSTARIWNSTRNTYDRAPAQLVEQSPLRVSVRDVHAIWNLYDGYDWDRTRDEITRTVEEVENKAMERRKRREPATYEEDEDEDVDVIGDYLFNSIYIGIPANRDPRELAQMVNADLNDNATFTETESTATTAITPAGSRAGGVGQKPKKKLRLSRSRHHKITFEVSGVNADMIVFPPGSGETQSSIDVRVQNLTIFDHIPTSTWKMFATYDKDAGEREMNTSMIRLEILNVKPHADLAASEIVLRATVQPLRLHVDQDALDFITRFFEFKDDKVPAHSSASDVPFLQRVEVMSIPVQLDFKPKRVDYGGLRSGRTTEFMNFIVLDQARMVLRHTIIYGVSGFDRMGKTLNDIWMPDVKRTQLPGVLAGLAPIRGLVNIGSGFKDLVEIPVKEYQKDGRIFRSLKMGATAFARTTGTEMIKLGAKMAVGTQTALQGAEGLLSTANRTATGTAPVPATAEATTWDGDDPSDAEEQRKQISLYSDQPTGVIQGLRGGYASLARDLHVARDAVIAVPGEVMESQNAQGLAQVMMRRAPTIIFRPAIGASKAIGKTLMGATNSLDPQNRRRMDEKYKRH